MSLLELALLCLHLTAPSCAQPPTRQLSRANRFRQTYAGALEVSPLRPAADCAVPPPSGSEDQTPAHLQRRLTGLASQVKDFATRAMKQILASEHSMSVSFSSRGGTPAH